MHKRNIFHKFLSFTIIFFWEGGGGGGWDGVKNIDKT